MQFEYTEAQTEMERLFGGFHHINAFGPIETGDAKEFNKFLNRVSPPPFAMTYINSTGGDVEDAIAIARLIRQHSLWTGVGSYVLDHRDASSPIVGRKLLPGICASAATLMYLGGRFRFLDRDARFGVHQFRIHGEVDKLYQSQVISSSIASFLHDVGIRPDFLQKTSSVPSSSLQDLDHNLLKTLGIVTDAVDLPEWTVEARNNSIYLKAERDTIYGYQKLCFRKILGGSHYLHAVFDPQGRHEEILQMACVEITINGEDKIVDVSDRTFRAVENTWLNAIVPLTSHEVDIIGTATSYGLRFRHSSSADMFLGIDSIPTEGVEQQLKTIVALSRT